MSQLENIESIEKRLWSSADQLRANSSYASNEYFLPVMGLIFLRHAYSRFLAVKDDIVADLPKRGGKTRPLTKEDFSKKSAIFLREEAQFDYLVNLPDDKDRVRAVIDAMESIEEDYEALKGQLPKLEYQELDDDTLEHILRTFNDPALKKATGDIFGRIYEYFLTQFADQKAHDGGEFFTPVSLVQLIVNVIEPDHGSVLDPACGSGGMFVQSGHFIEQHDMNPAERATFYGMEKNPTTIRLANMNLAVHGMEGKIQQAISYYNDPHELFGKADFVMANPPFNVDEVDAEKVKNDPRLPYGLPSVNKNKKVSNGNYLWISYFDSYLSEKGRAGFVMSSQASSAGGGEALVRQKLIESGHVDAMVDIRSGFFYTRTVPCQLWFLDKGKPEERKGKVLMIDARNVNRKVTRKIYDFSPEQLKNLTSIVWLHKGEQERFLELIADHLDNMHTEAEATAKPIAEFKESHAALLKTITPFIKTLDADDKHAETWNELEEVADTLEAGLSDFATSAATLKAGWNKSNTENSALHAATEATASKAERSRDLIKQIDLLYKLSIRVVDICEKELEAKGDDLWVTREVNTTKKALDENRKDAVAQLKLVRYFHRHAGWLQERFPDAELCDVEGLVKLVDKEELAANDWSLTPGRYVGVAPEEEDKDFDFEEALRNIHVELVGLNEEAAGLAVEIATNFEDLGI